MFVVCYVGRGLYDGADHPPREVLPGLCVYLIMCDVDTSTVKRPVLGCCATEVQVRVYTVRLISFMTGIIKCICVKEITLLLFSFRHRSLVNIHTDLHEHTASGCLCRSRHL